ncbi:Cof-type HAD-IIB family hydrolase [Pectobacterium brasiliense]|uniref:Cof-type HAD-IIB family hydrolase n=1 Tax=Pectobacterium brasiliense TaxID=180957 RepID=UPI0032EC3B84
MTPHIRQYSPSDSASPFKLAVFDLDGTVLTPEKTVTPRFIAALELARRQSIHIAFASGRSLPSVLDFMAQMLLRHTPAFAIACNGAEIWSEQEQRLIAVFPLDAPAIGELRELSRTLGVNCYALHTNMLVSHVPVGMNAAVRRLSRFQVAVESDAVSPVTQTPKMMFIEEAEQIDALIRRIPDDYRQRYHMVRSEPHYFEVMRQGVHKGTACAYLARYLGIQPANVFALGNEHNDREMLAFAGLGVAMANASASVKEHADWVTDSNSEDGAAKAVEMALLHASDPPER